MRGLGEARHRWLRKRNCGWSSSWPRWSPSAPVARRGDRDVRRRDGDVRRVVSGCGVLGRMEMAMRVVVLGAGFGGLELTRGLVAVSGQILVARAIAEPRHLESTQYAGLRLPERSPAAGFRTCPRRSCGSSSRVFWCHPVPHSDVDQVRRDHIVRLMPPLPPVSRAGLGTRGPADSSSVHPNLRSRRGGLGRSAPATRRSNEDRPPLHIVAEVVTESSRPLNSHRRPPNLRTTALAARSRVRCTAGSGVASCVCRSGDSPTRLASAAGALSSRRSVRFCRGRI